MADGSAICLGIGEVSGRHLDVVHLRMPGLIRDDNVLAKLDGFATQAALWAQLSQGTQDYPDRASAPSIIATAFARPYTATNEPKRGPFS